MMPAGEELTPPEPTWVVVRMKVLIAKVAVTDWAWVIETVQVVAVPVQAPLQPVKLQPVAGVSVKTTEVSVLKIPVVEPGAANVMPAGVELTPPEPTWVTLKVSVIAKVAATVRAWVIETVQVVAVPVQAPLQPINVQPASGLSVKTTEVL